MARGLIATSSTWATIPIRLALAVIFVAHGAQKVLGSFNGPGFNGFTSGSTPFSFMRPPWVWLAAAAISELVGGVLVGLGLLTRLGAFLLACVMLTAMKIHWPSFFDNNHGIEYPLALFAMSFALLISGGGMASIDLALSSGRQRIGKGKR